MNYQYHPWDRPPSLSLVRMDYSVVFVCLRCPLVVGNYRYSVVANRSLLWGVMVDRRWKGADGGDGIPSGTLGN